MTRSPGRKRRAHHRASRTLQNSAALKANIKFKINLSPGFGPESAQNLRFPSENDSPDPPPGPPGGVGAKNKIKNAQLGKCLCTKAAHTDTEPNWDQKDTDHDQMLCPAKCGPCAAWSVPFRGAKMSRTKLHADHILKCKTRRNICQRDPEVFVWPRDFLEASKNTWPTNHFGIHLNLNKF